MPAEEQVLRVSANPNVNGVWAVINWDHGSVMESVHRTELEALRTINGRAYGEVYFLPYGVDVPDATRKPVGSES